MMIRWLIGIPARLKLWGVVILGALAFLALFAAKISANTASRIRGKQAKATIKGIEAGSKGAAKAQDDLRKGKTPDQIVRENDSKWD
ncbi:MAG: hypothetical protein ACRCWF_03005 [Beijerinckiaceae bacterium]